MTSTSGVNLTNFFEFNLLRLFCKQDILTALLQYCPAFKNSENIYSKKALGDLLQLVKLILTLTRGLYRP